MRDALAMRFAQIVHDEICGCGEPHRSHGDIYLTIGRALRREVGPPVPPPNPLLAVAVDGLPARPLS